MTAVTARANAATATELLRAGQSDESVGKPAARASAENHGTVMRRANEPQGASTIWLNKQRTIRTPAASRITPTSTAEVSDHVSAIAAKGGERIRPVATGHSWSDITVTDARTHILDMTQMNRVLAISAKPDGSGALVTAQAGIRLVDLNRELQASGYTFRNLGSMMYQTLGGAIATNTHGTGLQNGGLSTAVEELVLVGGDGTTYQCSRTCNPDVFHAALGGVGMVGVVTEVTFHAVPKFNIERTTKVLSARELVEASGDDGVSGLERLARSHGWVQGLWLAFSDTVMAEIGDRTDKPATYLPNAERDERNGRRAICFASAAMPYIRPLVPSLVSMAANVIADFKRNRDDTAIVVSNDKAFTHQLDPKLLSWDAETEFYLPVRFCGEALAAMRRELDAMRNEGVCTGAPFVAFRFIRGDDFYLSPAYTNGGDDAFVCFSTYDYQSAQPKQVPRLYRALQAVVGHDPTLIRMHLGKIAQTPPERLHEHYVKWPEFVAARHRADPHGAFLNPFSERMLADVKNA